MHCKWTLRRGWADCTLERLTFSTSLSFHAKCERSSIHSFFISVVSTHEGFEPTRSSLASTYSLFSHFFRFRTYMWTHPYIICNGKNDFGVRTIRFSNRVLERIMVENRGSTVFVNFNLVIGERGLI